MEPAGHDANGFGRLYLHEWEVHALYKKGYMAPPYFQCPSTWRLSTGGIPIPPVPHGATRSAAINQHNYEGLTPEQRADPIWDPDNIDQWSTFFTQRCNHDLAQCEGTALCGQQERRRAEYLVGHPRTHPCLRPRPHRRGQQLAARNAACAALDAALDGDPGFVVIALFLVHAEDTACRRHRHRLVVCVIYGDAQNPPPLAEGGRLIWCI
jgi:hypothetical protein